MNQFKEKIVRFLAPFLYKSAHHRSFFTLIGIVFKEFQMLFAQFFTWQYPFFSIYRVFSIGFSVLCRLFLGRSLKYSFGFTGEDRIIESILKPLIQQNGFYVDVGCNHPTFLSNTYSLYRKGWRGICIDGNQQLIAKFSKYRPKDLAICALVSDTERSVIFYEVENNVLSTIENEVAESYQNEGLVVRPVKTKTQTLTSILRQNNAPSVFDLLTIDAEDHDFQVLISLDFDLYRPKLIVVEDDTFEPNQLAENRFCQFLASKGYKLEAFVLDNLYFTIE